MTASRRLLFHPLTILACALLSSILFGLLGERLPNFSGGGQILLWAYHVPIAFAFVVYAFDCLQQLPVLTWPRRGLIVLVTALALARAIIDGIPFYSGHALFLTFMLCTASTRLTRNVAVLVFAIVIFFKLLATDLTLLGGLLLGLLFFFVYRCLPRSSDFSREDTGTV